MFTVVSPVVLVLVVRAMVVVLIPALALSLLKITNDKSLMGPHKNSWLTNGLLLLLVAVSVFLTCWNAVDFLAKR